MTKETAPTTGTEELTEDEIYRLVKMTDWEHRLASRRTNPKFFGCVKGLYVNLCRLNDNFVEINIRYRCQAPITHIASGDKRFIDFYEEVKQDYEDKTKNWTDFVTNEERRLSIKGMNLAKKLAKELTK